MNQNLFRKSSLWFGGQLTLHLLVLLSFKLIFDDDRLEEWSAYWLFITPVIYAVINMIGFIQQRKFKKEAGTLSFGGKIWFTTVEVFSVGMTLIWIAGLAGVLVLKYYYRLI